MGALHVWFRAKLTTKLPHEAFDEIHAEEPSLSHRCAGLSESWTREQMNAEAGTHVEVNCLGICRSSFSACWPVANGLVICVFGPNSLCHEVKAYTA